MIVSRRGNLER